MTKLDWTRRTNRHINFFPKQKEEKRRVELTSSSLLWFGKYKGESVANIIKSDKQYLVWLMKQSQESKKNNVLSFSAELILQLIKKE